MKLLLATNNSHKAQEIKAILGSYFTDIFTLKEAGVSFEAIENGTTFEENALIKAQQTLDYVGDRFDAALADDSGLCVDALNGAPGVYSARFAGAGHNDADNNALLLKKLENYSFDQRTAHFVSCIALVRRGMPPICVRGSVDGTILFEAHGSNGFGYDPYFWYAPFRKSFAELTPEEKNSVSHRHNALIKLKEVLDGTDRNLL